eukprot:6488675-Amphidinium_carterae.1
MSRVAIGHELSTYEVLNKEGQTVHRLLACTLCGAYAHRKLHKLGRPCPGGGGSTTAQAKRLAKGVHPQRSKNHRELSVRFCDRVTVEECRAQLDRVQ